MNILNIPTIIPNVSNIPTDPRTNIFSSILFISQYIVTVLCIFQKFEEIKGLLILLKHTCYT